MLLTGPPARLAGLRGPSQGVYLVHAVEMRSPSWDACGAVQRGARLAGG